MSTRKQESATARGRSRTRRGALLAWTIPVMLLAPLGLGAKGCGAAVVGDDCADDFSENCAGAGGGVNTGGQTAQGGKVAQGGKSAQGGRAGEGGGTPATGGAPGMTSCGSLAGEQCAAGEYCAFPLEAQCGVADGEGVCTKVPSACDDIYQPVCGCDGKDYANECEAAGAGVSVAKQGKCDDPVGTSCGGFSGRTCKDGEFCSYAPDAQCGAADQPGVCTPIPKACDVGDADYKPVCGCDGATYPNACMAYLKSVAVAKQGECSPKYCGGLGNAKCAADEYCSYVNGGACGITDAPGVCQKLPTVCNAQSQPACGCNGETYANLCEAAEANAWVRALDECPSLGRPCGDTIDSVCGAGEYCKYEPPSASVCGERGGTGYCTAKPTTCETRGFQVCGCDGVLYDNSCEAARAGVSEAWQYRGGGSSGEGGAGGGGNESCR